MQFPILHWEAWKWQLRGLVTCMFWAEQQTPVATLPSFLLQMFGAGLQLCVLQQAAGGSWSSSCLWGALMPSHSLPELCTRQEVQWGPLKICQHLWRTQRCHACSTGKAALNLQMRKIQASKMEEFQNIYLNHYLLESGEHITKSVLQIDIWPFTVIYSGCFCLVLLDYSILNLTKMFCHLSFPELECIPPFLWTLVQIRS